MVSPTHSCSNVSDVTNSTHIQKTTPSHKITSEKIHAYLSVSETIRLKMLHNTIGCTEATRNILLGGAGSSISISL